MYIILGKRWIKWDMIQGLKMAIFVNEAEIEMDKEKYDNAVERKAKLEKDMEDLSLSEIPDALSLLPEEEKEDQKALKRMEQKLKHEREEQLQQFRNQIKSAENEIQMADGQLAKTYSIAYSNRRKYDFMKNYKVKATYADN